METLKMVLGIITQLMLMGLLGFSFYVMVYAHKTLKKQEEKMEKHEREYEELIKEADRIHDELEKKMVN